MYAYEQALKCRPRYIRAHVNMGMAYSAVGRPDEAAKSYATAMEHAAASTLPLQYLSASCKLITYPIVTVRGQDRVRMQAMHFLYGSVSEFSGTNAGAMKAFEELSKVRGCVLKYCAATEAMSDILPLLLGLRDRLCR